jgi:hypothetical protein
MRKAELDHHIILTFMISFSCFLYMAGWAQRYPGVMKDTVALPKKKELRNGLLGGVVFCNAGSVSELRNNRFEVIYPGFGIGLRIKFNKFSNTNACLDYGIGTKGSRGFFGNLGEVF